MGRPNITAAWIAAEQGLHVCGCGCGEVIEIKPHHMSRGIPTFRNGHAPYALGPRKQPGKVAVWLAENAGRHHCQCGCGGIIELKRHHFTLGVPRYISGHNARGQVHSTATKGRMSTAMRGARNHRYGKRPPNFKGRTIRDDGYVIVQARGHPFAHRGKNHILEHRLVMEAFLRDTEPEHPALVAVDGVLYLARGWDVHHINEDRADNRLENLMCLTTADHSRLHSELGRHAG